MRRDHSPKDSSPTPGAGVNRRAFLRAGAALGASSLIGPRVFAVARPAPILPADAKAKTVVQIFLGGGLSHLDTFDPKPEQSIEIRGSFRAIGTKLDGVRFADTMRSTAAIADKIVLLRGFGHGEAAHERGYHSVMTGYAPSPAIAYPSYGSVVAHELGASGDLPPYICVPNDRIAYSGPGYLSTAFAPFSVESDPASRNFKVRDLEPPKGIDENRSARRRRMLEALNGGFEGRVEEDALTASAAFHQQAYRMLDSPAARKAFDMTKENDKVRNAYGRSTIGARLILARRLVEAGVRWITVSDGGWDHHRDLFRNARTKMQGLDRAFAVFLRDLEKRGLLDQTLVLLTSEFGRTPRVNKDNGRDHWPKVFTVVAAGAGLKRGFLYGNSDERGSEPAENPTSPADLAATVFSQMGIDPEKRLMSPGDRPIDIVRGGRVLEEILA